MPFKHGKGGELWLNEVDISNYFHSVDFHVKVTPADVTTFKTGGVATTWKGYIAGLQEATVTAAGYYDSSEADQVRETLQEVAGTALGQLTYAPAGAVVVGDECRLVNINSTDYKTGSQTMNPISLSWTAMSTAPVGIGTCLAPLATYAVAAGATPGGDGVNGGAQTTTGAVAHLHVTAMTGGNTHTFKLQDSTTLGGVYVDIVGGGFTDVTAVGSQRLVIPGTIRAFVRLLYTVAGSSAKFGCAVART